MASHVFLRMEHETRHLCAYEKEGGRGGEGGGREGGREGGRKRMKGAMASSSSGDVAVYLVQQSQFPCVHKLPA